MESKELQREIGKKLRENTDAAPKPLEELVKENVELGAAIVVWNRNRAKRAKKIGLTKGHPPNIEGIMKWARKISNSGFMKEEDVFELPMYDQDDYFLAEDFVKSYNKKLQPAETSQPKEQKTTA